MAAARATRSSTAATTVTTLALKNSHVHGSFSYGINAQKCNLVIDASVIESNTNGGITLNNSATYSITNSFIINNSATGVFIDPSATGTFAFNTVANNASSTSAPGGVNCGSGTPTIANSIIAANTPSQLFGNCVLSSVVTGDTPGGIMSPPHFVDAANAQR